MLWCAKWFPRKLHPGSTLEIADTKDPQWCAIQRQANPPPKYADSLATLCGQFITLTGGIERTEPTCPECLAEAAKGKPRRKGRPVA
jgi:hypothetical protein